MPAESTTRRRMIAATARLLQRQGMAATGLNEVLEAAEAPRGSLYHHFPRGKNQLVAEAIRFSGARITGAIEAAMADAPSVAAAVRAFGTFYEASLASSDYRDGCPVASTALQAAALAAPEVEAACADAFAAWQQPIARRLESEGHPPARAAALASFVIASLEGGLLLAQSRRDMEPLHIVVEQLVPLLAPVPPGG
jgi:TetR/AcrR family transcriptional repressor of lmrAB and yxaGH operons